MADMGGAEQKSTARVVAIRLWDSRWLLAAGVVAILVVYGFAGLSAYVVLLAFVLLLAAAMLPAAGVVGSSGVMAMGAPRPDYTLATGDLHCEHARSCDTR